MMDRRNSRWQSLEFFEKPAKSVRPNSQQTSRSNQSFQYRTIDQEDKSRNQGICQQSQPSIPETIMDPANGSGAKICSANAPRISKSANMGKSGRPKLNVRNISE